MTNTKDELVKLIKEWVLTENNLKNSQKEVKKYRDYKKDLTQQLLDVMKDNEIDCFDINDGKIIYTKNTVKSPINKNYLYSSLEQYFTNDLGLNNIDFQGVVQHIMNNRKSVTKENIKLKKNKNT